MLQAIRIKGKTMLQTIADLLNGNAKIVLTTRKTAILSGEDFYEWYEETVTEKEKFYILRYKLEQPIFYVRNISK